jgi:hypothetical protein
MTVLQRPTTGTILLWLAVGLLVATALLAFSVYGARGRGQASRRGRRRAGMWSLNAQSRRQARHVLGHGVVGSQHP